LVTPSTNSRGKSAARSRSAIFCARSCRIFELFASASTKLRVPSFTSMTHGALQPAVMFPSRSSVMAPRSTAPW